MNEIAVTVAPAGPREIDVTAEVGSRPAGYDEVARQARRRIHLQPTPATEWVIDHDLGRRPIVTVYDTTGRVIHADVSAPSDSLVIVKHSLPVDGEAHMT